jgi:hypothetical protein
MQFRRAGMQTTGNRPGRGTGRAGAGTIQKGTGMKKDDLEQAGGILKQTGPMQRAFDLAGVAPEAPVKDRDLWEEAKKEFKAKFPFTRIEPPAAGKEEPMTIPAFRSAYLSLAYSFWLEQNPGTQLTADSFVADFDREDFRRGFRAHLVTTLGLGEQKISKWKTTPQSRHHFTRQKQLDVLVGIPNTTFDEKEDLGFLTRMLTLCCLPRTNPGNKLQYIRKNGPYRLVMVAGPDNKLPYGVLPRLLLAWICSEAVRTKSPVLTLGKSLIDFMRQLGMYSDSGGEGQW